MRSDSQVKFCHITLTHYTIFMAIKTLGVSRSKSFNDLAWRNLQSDHESYEDCEGEDTYSGYGCAKGCFSIAEMAGFINEQRYEHLKIYHTNLCRFEYETLISSERARRWSKYNAFINFYELFIRLMVVKYTKTWNRNLKNGKIQ